MAAVIYTQIHVTWSQSGSIANIKGTFGSIYFPLFFTSTFTLFLVKKKNGESTWLLFGFHMLSDSFHSCRLEHIKSEDT